MEDFFFDERPTQNPDNPWSSDPGSGGTVWGEWGNTPDDTPDTPKDPDDPWYQLSGKWKLRLREILKDGSGMILTDATGIILSGVDGCLSIKVECQIQSDNAGSHVRCLILRTILQSGEISKHGMLDDLTTQGRLTLGCCWQAGHYDHATHHTVRFRINEGIITPWIFLPLNPGLQNIAELVWTGTELKVESVRST